jgi:molecular chaperone GrpE
MKVAQPKANEDQPRGEKKGQPIPVKIIQGEEDPIRVTDKRFWVQDGAQEADETLPYSFKPSYVEELEKKLSDSQKKIEEILSSSREFKQQSAGEVQKARERIQNEFNRRSAKIKSDLVSKFIEILDNFQRALAIASQKHSFDTLLEGVELIQNQFIAALTEHDVTELNVEGQPFNPEFAEAVEVIEVETPEKDNLILEVVNKGYRMGDFLIRPAKVKIGRVKVPTQEPDR